MCPGKKEPNMTNPALDAVVQLIREENKYDNLPAKAVNKLLYLVHKEANRRGLNVTVPYFWYMFGTVASDAADDWGTDTGPEPDIDPNPVDQNRDDINQLRTVVSDVLDMYYENSLEYITDLTYQDAPYNVQPKWRELDKKLATRNDEYKDFFEEGPSVDEIRESVDAVYDSFPVSRYSQHQSDFLNWYSIMTREILSTDPDLDRMMNANLSFWRIFSLTIAENHRHEMTKEDVLDALSIESFEAAREASRDDLRRIQEEALEERFDSETASIVELEAADALAEAMLASRIAGME